MQQSVSAEALLRRLADPAERQRQFAERLHAGWRADHPYAWDGEGVAPDQPTAAAMGEHVAAHYAADLPLVHHVNALIGAGAGEQLIGVSPAQQRPHTDDYEELKRLMATHPDAQRTLLTPGRHGAVGGLLDAAMAPVFGATIALLAPKVPMWVLPERIPPAEFVKWHALPHAFPVWVQWPLARMRGDPVFGVGLATHFLFIKRGPMAGGALPLAGLFTGPPVAFLAVHELTPFGRVPGIEYQLGVWKVPLGLTRQMTIALELAAPAENLVVLVDSRGRRFSVSFIDFLRSSKREYRLARRAVKLQYPGVTGTAMNTQYVTEVPSEHAPFPVAPSAQGDEEEDTGEDFSVPSATEQTAGGE